MFTCETCLTKAGDAEMLKHLGNTRHKNVVYNKSGDLIACEECEDSNINQLVLARFGLSDMSLLCPVCLKKDEAPSTQYTLQNGSLLKKLPDYYKVRDLVCQTCGSNSKLFVSPDQGKIVLCKKCLEEKDPKPKELVPDTSDTFLLALLGIKEHVQPKSSGRQRGRKVGRGKKGKGRGRKPPSKPQDIGDKEPTSHYHLTKAVSAAYKSGKTVAAVGSTNISPIHSKPSSKMNTRSLSRSSTPQPSSGSKSHAKIGRKGGEKGTPKVAYANGTNNPVKPASNMPDSRFGKGSNKTNPKIAGKSFAKEKEPASLPKDIAPRKKALKDVTDESKFIKNHQVKTNSVIDGKHVKEGKHGKDGKSVKRDTNPSQSNEKHFKTNRNLVKDNRKHVNEGTSKEKSSKNSKDFKSTDDKSSKSVKSAKPDLNHQNAILKGIKQYVPSQDPPLKYNNLTEYFQELSYNLFLEELASVGLNGNIIINPDDMYLEWFQEQDKRHKQYKISIPMVEDILNRFLSKKMQSLKKKPFQVNQTLFLMIDKVAWYGNVVVSDIVKSGKNKRQSVLEVVVELYPWNDQNLPTTVNVQHLRILPASVPVSRVFTAMTKISNPKFVLMLLGNEPIRQIVFNNRIKYNRDLNDSQRVAIQSVLNNSITVLQGPPGTGKTSTIYEIILQLVEVLHTFPISVVAASNIAIDNIAEKLMENHEREILRIVSLEKESEYNLDHPLASICLHRKVFNDLPQNMKETLKDMRDPRKKVLQNQYKKLLQEQIRISQKYVANAKVLFSTTVVSGGNQFKDIKKVPVIIMDEATQSSEATTLIPLSIEGVEKFVFVGDQRQLSSFSQVPNLSLSLFERVLLNGTYRTPHMLDTQYRMHPAISDFPRKRFYNGLLKDGITAEHRKIDNIPGNPVFFWDTAETQREQFVKTKFREDRGYTYSNRGEVNDVTQVITQLIVEKGIKRCDIGVITPYRGQRDLISSILVKNDVINPEKLDLKVEVDRDDIYNDSKPATIHTVNDIMIASIDAFQGREVNFLILSCVRSNEEGKIGFLKDERRLNVALTRAKYGLIVIGDSKCLKAGDPLWKDYIEDLESKNSVHATKEFTY